MDDTTSAFQDMDLDEPVRRSKKRRRVTAKPANSPVLLNPNGLSNGVPSVQPPSALGLGITSFVPDAAASNAFTDQVRLQIASIRSQLVNMERDQRALRQQLHELERFVRRSQPQLTNTPQHKTRSAKNVQIRVLLHRLSSSAEPSQNQDFSANIAAGRAKNMHNFCRVVSEAFDPVMIEAYGESLKLVEGTMQLKIASETSTENDSLFYFDHKKLQMISGRYKGWYKDNVTLGTEDVVEVEVWDQADRTGQDNSERKESAEFVDDVNMNVEEAV